MSLPLPWIEKIFLKMSLTFGKNFLQTWEGIPIEDVKNDWAYELRGFIKSPAALAYGLSICVEGKPPTVAEFRAACARYNAAPGLMLPASQASPEIVQSYIANIKTLGQMVTGDKDWAKRLQHRHEGGDTLSPNQIRCYRQALRLGS